MEEILLEAAEAGRRGWEFVGWWVGKVCRNPARVGFIDQATHDRAEAAWRAVRAAAGPGREGS